MPEPAAPVAAEGIVRFAPRGRIEGAAARALGVAFRDALRGPGARWLVDLRLATFVDSLALGEIATFARALRTAGGDVVLCGPPPGVRRAFEITGLHHVLDIADDEESALQWLRALPSEDDSSARDVAP